MTSIRTVLLLVLAAGCATKAAEKQGQNTAHANLKVQLRELVTNYNRSVQLTARAISNATDDPMVKRHAITWKQFTFTAGQRARLSGTPSLALLDLWVMSLQRREFFTAEGEGRHWFGEQQSIASQTEGAMVAYIERVSKQNIPAEFFDEVKRDVEAFATEHPISGMIRQSKAALSHESRKNFKWVGKLTAPFSLGVKDTAAAISEVSESVDEIADVVENLPQLGRWNAELLVLDMDNNPTIVDLRGDVDRANDNIARIVDTVESMPAKVQMQVSKTLDEIDAKQAGLRVTLNETKELVTEAKGTVEVANETVENVKKTLAEAEKSVQSIERTTAAFSEAGTAWKPTVEEATALLEIIDKWVPEKDPNAPPPDPNAPDSLDSLARTAEGLAKTAPELRASIADLKTMLSAGELPQAVDSTLDRTTRNMEGLIDHLTWRMIQLAFAVAFVALGYRFAVVRLIKK